MRSEVTLAPRHVVAVVGAATAGSEVAHILAERGALVIVFEQNPRPYGKIEDGLPRWHVDQRQEEYQKINSKLAHPNVEYVPLTRLGRDVHFDELKEPWGLSALVLTTGAWRDRPFPVEGADRFVDDGLVYQNRFIYWFNHYFEPGYSGPRYEIKPGTVVVGGGLASIDVIKVLQLELALRALAKRGIVEDLVKLEREGIEPVLTRYGLDWAGLAVTPCKLFYRRRVIDMPLSDIPPDAPPKRREAMRQARVKIMEKAQRKYLFAFEERRVPTGLVVDGDRLLGLQMSRTEVTEDGRKVSTIPNTQEPLEFPMIISSVGSIPEPIPGIPRKGEVYDYADFNIGLLMEGPTLVFAAGNVLTGKGNIKDSLDNATEIGSLVAEAYLGLTDHKPPIAEGARKEAQEQGLKIASAVTARQPLAPDKVEAILARVRERQRAVSYDRDYRAWIAKFTPPQAR